MENLITFFKENGFDLYKAEEKFGFNKLDMINYLKNNNFEYQLLRELFHSPEDMPQIYKSIVFYQKYFTVEDDFFGFDYGHRMLAFDEQSGPKFIGWTLK